MDALKTTKIITITTAILCGVCFSWLMVTLGNNHKLQDRLDSEKLRSELLLSEKLLLEKTINGIDDNSKAKLSGDAGFNTDDKEGQLDSIRHQFLLLERSYRKVRQREIDVTMERKILLRENRMLRDSLRRYYPQKIIYYAPLDDEPDLACLQRSIIPFGIWIL